MHQHSDSVKRRGYLIILILPIIYWAICQGLCNTNKNSAPSSLGKNPYHNAWLWFHIMIFYIYQTFALLGFFWFYFCLNGNTALLHSTWKTVLAPSKAKLPSAAAKIRKHLVYGRESYPHLLPVIIIHKGCHRDLNVPFDHFCGSCQCVTRAEPAKRSNQKAINAQVSIYMFSRIQNPPVNIK